MMLKSVPSWVKCKNGSLINDCKITAILNICTWQWHKLKGNWFIVWPISFAIKLSQRIYLFYRIESIPNGLRSILSQNVNVNIFWPSREQTSYFNLMEETNLLLKQIYKHNCMPFNNWVCRWTGIVIQTFNQLWDLQM